MKIASTLGQPWNTNMSLASIFPCSEQMLFIRQVGRYGFVVKTGFCSVMLKEGK